MKDIYVLSGLGADERVFKSIDFSERNVTFVKWISPVQDESIDSYAKRLLSQIGSARPTLIGLSFGGMMAIEICKQIDVSKVILISSAKTKSEIPFYFRWVRLLGLHKIIPVLILTKSNWLVRWLFGVEDEIEKVTLEEILSETDPLFSKWAIGKIVTWENDYIPKNITHIHGTTDKLLPMANCDFEIKGGGHLMILNKAQEISKLLEHILG